MVRRLSCVYSAPPNQEVFLENALLTMVTSVSLPAKMAPPPMLLRLVRNWLLITSSLPR